MRARASAFIRRQTPYGMVSPDDPVFKCDARRMRWYMIYERFVRGSRNRIFYGTAIIIGVTSVLGVLISLLFSSRHGLTTVYSAVVILMLILTILINAMLDVLGLSTSLPSFSADIKSGRWELLRLTPLREGVIIRAKHAAAQLSLWNLLLISLTLRISILLLVFLNAVIEWVNEQYAAWRYIEQYALYGALNPTVSFSLGLIGGTIFGMVFLMEPVWRLRGMTALGLAISAHVYEGNRAVLVSAGSLLILWFVQLMAVFGILSSIVIIPIMMLSLTDQVVMLPLTLYGLAGAAWLVLIGIFYLLQNWSLRRIAWQLVNLNQ